MSETNQILREILQEIRDVKTHGIPPSVPVPPVLSSAGSGSGRSISPTGLLTSGFSLGGKVKNAELESIKAGIQNGRYSRQGSERESNLAKASSMLKWYNNTAAKGKEGGKAFQSRRNYARNLVNSLARPSAVASAGGGGEEDENENCPAESFTGPPQLPNASRNARLMGRMSKDEVAGLSKEDKKRRCELKKLASEQRKASRLPEEQAKINARVAAMQAGRAKSKASAGGGPYAEESAEERQTRKRKNRRNRTRKN